MSGRDAVDPESAWTQLPLGPDYDDAWDRFEGLYGFRASMKPEGWPAIREPEPSITFDLSVITDGPRRGSATASINAEALRSFVWALGDVDELVVLDWQHPLHLFRPTTQAVLSSPEWPVTVYPDGDYYAFLTPDMREGTFGHPWEQTLCVIGDRLGQSLAPSLRTWLPVLRRNGRPTVA